MFSDIVFPHKNEKEFVRMAEALGFDKLLFVYDKKNLQEGMKRAAGLEPGLKIVVGVKGKQRKVPKGVVRVVKSPEDVRGVTMSKSADLIYDVEYSDRHDFMHHRNAGLNQVIARLMAEKKVRLGINVSRLKKLQSFDRGIVLGRMRQNLQLARKYTLQVTVGSFATDPYLMTGPQEMMALLKLLGMEEHKRAFQGW